MSQKINPTVTAVQAAPIANFSQCHVGIVSQLDLLAELPPLIEPAQRARSIASDMLAFFDAVIIEHHREEEEELFSATLKSATKGAEMDRVKAMVERLTSEHRQIEAWWSRLKPQMKLIAKGRDTRFDAQAVEQLVKDYRAHAHYEEAEFLPLSQTILARNSNHMAALGLSLHMRHAKPTPGYV